ncbi:MAG: fibronectin type III domain-containing protein [Ignavibacteria bacterium]
MRKLIILMLLLTTYIFIDSSAQEMPLVYDVENTGSDCPIPYLPSISELPSIPSLPDPFAWADGRGRMSNFSDWRYRRAEIKAEIENYEIGEKPVRPDTIEASFSGGILTVIVTENGQTLTLTSQVVLPSGTGPFPAVIGLGGFSGSGSIPSDIFSSRDIAQITFNHNQVTTYGNPINSNPYYLLYPHLNITNTGQYSAWAWGVSRIIDGMELVQNVLPIDLKHLAVTGCSYAGKMAIFAGAFDERIALTIGQESGGGGYTTWRYSEEINKIESVETLGKTDYNWFKDAMRQFSSAVSKLPEDHHELMAMVAPRALLVTGNPDYVWLADESGHVGSKAAKEVWNALGIPDRFGYSIVSGHTHCQVPGSQIPEIEAFVEKFLLGNTTANTNITTTPYSTNLSNWITWTNPVLSNDTSFFGRASLIYPSNLQSGLDTTNLTFSWNKVQDAEKYFFQLSTNAIFTNIVESDSTTDTVVTVSDLPGGKRFYWRIQAKSADSFGPFSDVRNFTTFVPLPAAPELADAAPYQDRIDYYTFTWKKVNYADQYFIQLSHVETFASIFKSDSTTSDTFKTISGFSEGRKEYWRVKAANVAGSSTWSDSSVIIKLKAPTNLVLQKSASNEITLTWSDHSSREDGYIIERKQSSETSFAVLDTSAGGNQYVDLNIEQAETYTYRVKAYSSISESDYSNEASLLTDVKQERAMPTEYSISQNYPNPFNPTTKIKFALPQTALTKIIIYDLLGREVRTIINKELEAGYHEINIDADNFPSGVYFYRIQSGNFINTKKMILMR